MVNETSGFKIGDVVRLKSGGPKMVVTNLQAPTASRGKPQAALAFVRWLDVAGHMQRDTINVLLLEK